jgi:hypothetical protein
LVHGALIPVGTWILPWLLFCREILRGVNDEWANLGDLACILDFARFSLQFNLIAWKQGSWVKTVARHYRLLDPLLIPCHMHVGLLLVNVSVPNTIRYQQVRESQTIKITQMEMSNIAVLLPPGRLLVMIAM